MTIVTAANAASTTHLSAVDPGMNTESTGTLTAVEPGGRVHVHG